MRESRAGRSRRWISTLALLAPAAVAGGPAAPQSCVAPLRIDRHVVELRGVAPPDLAARVESLGGRLVRVHPEVGVAVAEGLDDAGAAELARHPGVAHLERDALVRMIPHLDSMPWAVMELPAAGAPAGHDPREANLFEFQWDMHQIGADRVFEAGFGGDPSVRVAIVDTGLDPDHVDLRGLIDEAASTAFVESLTGPPAWADDNFHGTHVGGTVATNGIGTSGVAPHTQLVAVKVCDSTGFCAFGDVIAGILYAASQDVDVINMSFSGAFSKREFGFFGGLLARSVNFANRQGALVVGSAGNAAADLQHEGDLLRWPCEVSVVSCISATRADDTLASYSSFGTNEISVAAPGGEFDGDRLRSMVLAPCSSRSRFLRQCASGDFYLFLQGTSMAAPHVSGAAALLDAQYRGGLDAGQLRARLESTAEDLGAPGADPEYGKGRLDLCRLLGCR